MREDTAGGSCRQKKGRSFLSWIPIVYNPLGIFPRLEPLSLAYVSTLWATPHPPNRCSLLPRAVQIDFQYLKQRNPTWYNQERPTKIVNAKSTGDATSTNQTQDVVLFFFFSPIKNVRFTRKVVLMNLFAGQEQRHRRREQSCGHSGGRKGWEDGWEGGSRGKGYV